MENGAVDFLSVEKLPTKRKGLVLSALYELLDVGQSIIARRTNKTLVGN
jgi:hypothetical protein